MTTYTAPTFTTDADGHLRPAESNDFERKLATHGLATIAVAGLLDELTSATAEHRTAAFTAHLVARAIRSENDQIGAEPTVTIPEAAHQHLPATLEWLNERYREALAGRYTMYASSLDLVRQRIKAIQKEIGQ